MLFQIEDKVSNTRHEVEQLRSALSRVTFDWSRPYKNFDDRKVKGLVARLVHVKDNKVRREGPFMASDVGTTT